MSTKFHGLGAQDIGLSSAALVTALLETLVAKDILEPSEVRELMQRASTDLDTLRTANGNNAAAMIRDRLLPMFSDEGSDQA